MTSSTPIDRIAETARLNNQALIDLLARHNLRLSRDLSLWRPTVQNVGTITGLEHLGELTILATDGIGAFFQQPDESVLFGHIQHFTGEVKTLHSASKATGAGPKRQTKSKTKTSKAREVFFAHLFS